MLQAVRLLVIAFLAAAVARGILRSGRSRWRAASFLLFGAGALAVAVIRGDQFEPRDVLTLNIVYEEWSFGIPGLELPLALGYGLILGVMVAFPFQASGRAVELRQDLRRSLASAEATRGFMRWLTWVALGLLLYFAFVWLPYRLSNS
jgi:hypothetical protein